MLCGKLLTRSSEPYFVDKISTGFLAWTPFVIGYKPAGDRIATWEPDSQPSLDSIRNIITTDDYFQKLSSLWGQESNKVGGSVDLRADNVAFIKTLGWQRYDLLCWPSLIVLAKMFQHEVLDLLITVIDPLLSDADKFKQRAAGELLAGLLRGDYNDNFAAVYSC